MNNARLTLSRSRKGFSLGEILIVIVALGVLSAVVGYTVTSVREAAKEANVKRWIIIMNQTLNDAVSAGAEAYYFGPSGEEGNQGGEDFVKDTLASAEWQNWAHLAGGRAAVADTTVFFHFPVFPNGELDPGSETEPFHVDGSRFPPQLVPKQP